MYHKFYSYYLRYVDFIVIPFMLIGFSNLFKW